jgi:hypothetical protein
MLLAGRLLHARHQRQHVGEPDDNTAARGHRTEAKSAVSVPLLPAVAAGVMLCATHADRRPAQALAKALAQRAASR